MGMGSRVMRAGAVAASAVVAASGLSSMSYASFTASTKPTGVVDAQFSGSLTFATGLSITVDSSSRLVEPNSGTTNGTYLSGAIFPEVMADGLYQVTVTNALISNSDRGIGPGMCNSDGSVAVFAIICGNTTPARMYSYVGGTLTQQGTTASTYSTSNTDLLKLVPSLSGGIYTWTLYKNGTATACTWTDSAGLVGAPPKHPTACFRHVYSSGQSASPGIKAISAALI